MAPILMRGLSYHGDIFSIFRWYARRANEIIHTSIVVVLSVVGKTSLEERHSLLQSRDVSGQRSMHVLHPIAAKHGYISWLTKTFHQGIEAALFSRMHMAR
jgi:hypothetical protein